MEALEFLFEIQNTRERTLPLVVGIFLLVMGVLVLADLMGWRLKSAELSGKIIGFLFGHITYPYRCQCQVLHHRHVGKEVEILENHADFSPNLFYSL